MTRLRAGIVAGIAALAAAAVAVAPAAALDRPTGWDGSNPFVCTVQDAGYGATVPDPAADPYCVHFDKDRQNVTEFGIVDFLSQEPARFAAAASKCFYFQDDHWRATVRRGDETAIYEWIGHYFVDRARGDGGVWVTGFRVLGQTGDPSAIPGLPPDVSAVMGPGTGGFMTRNHIPVDPACAARAAEDPGAIYADPQHEAGPAGALPDLIARLSR